MLLRRFYHALYLTVSTVGWIWTRFFGFGCDHNYDINFTLCYHCGKRFTRGGIVYCPRCLEVFIQEDEERGEMPALPADEDDEGEDEHTHKAHTCGVCGACYQWTAHDIAWMSDAAAVMPCGCDWKWLDTMIEAKGE